MASRIFKGGVLKLCILTQTCDCLAERLQDSKAAQGNSRKREMMLSHSFSFTLQHLSMAGVRHASSSRNQEVTGMAYTSILSVANSIPTLYGYQLQVGNTWRFWEGRVDFKERTPGGYSAIVFALSSCLQVVEVSVIGPPKHEA